MKKELSVICVFILLSVLSYGQVGQANIIQMNKLLKQYGGNNVSPLHYEPTLGLINQEIPLGYTMHFKMSDIAEVLLIASNEGYTVQLLCKAENTCIEQISEKSSGTFLSGANFYLSDKVAAENFARYAIDIIQTDFLGNVKAAEALKKNTNSAKELATIEEPKVSEKLKVAEKPTKADSKKDHLSIGSYNQNDADYDDQELSVFGKKLKSVLDMAAANQLDKLKSNEIDGVAQSKIKLPKAKKNYINDYKGADCFIAEFGTQKYYEDLEELYYEIKDEIEASIPSIYEPVDMSMNDIYENSDDQVFHTEYYNIDNPTTPSVVIRIAPDGKENTLFIRIGKR